MNPTDRTRGRDYAVPELMAKRLCVRNVVPRLCCNQLHTYPALLPHRVVGDEKKNVEQNRALKLLLQYQCANRPIQSVHWAGDKHI